MASQATLFPYESEPEAHARRADPETSHAAAKSVQRIRQSQQLILDVLERHGPLTDEEIYKWARLEISPSGARTRRSELVDLGKVCDSGERAITKSGRKTIIWKLSYGQ